MPHPLSLMDRLRVERYVWALDSGLYGLPHRSRIETRRDVRRNALAAASDVGARTALRNLGRADDLADEYVRSHHGGRLRYSVMAAVVFLLGVQLLLTAFLSEAVDAFGRGITAVDPGVTGTFRGPGVTVLQSPIEWTFVGGRGTATGGAWTPLAYVLWLLGTVAVGRLWRIRLGRGRRRGATGTGAAIAQP